MSIQLPDRKAETASPETGAASALSPLLQSAPAPTAAPAAQPAIAQDDRTPTVASRPALDGVQSTHGAIIGSRPRVPRHPMRDWHAFGLWVTEGPAAWGRRITSPLGVLVLAALLILGLGGYGLGAATAGARVSGTGTGMGTASGQSAASSKPAKPFPAPAHQVYDAQPPAAAQGGTVDVNLTAQEALISIAPGVAYHAWTFNGTVPGPIIRVRQGQRVHFTLTNKTTMLHSIDFHAAQTAWNVNYQPIAPGKSFSFDWTANYPGVFMYHCGTPPVMDHMANGMYGAIIVDPASGWTPAQEYVLVQSEFYTHQNADGSYALDETKLMNNTPDYVDFNGYANQYKTAPLTAAPGQRIRLFLVNAGPSQFSAFHVIGAIFSDVYADGNPANRTQGDQTITVPPGGGSVVELTVPDAGLYPFVTHSFADADKGATGVIKVGQ